MTLFILVGTISKILNRRIEKKIERYKELIDLIPPSHASNDPFNLSLNSVTNGFTQRETEKQYEEAWSD